MTHSYRVLCVDKKVKLVTFRGQSLLEPALKLTSIRRATLLSPKIHQPLLALFCFLPNVLLVVSCLGAVVRKLLDLIERVNSVRNLVIHSVLIILSGWEEESPVDEQEEEELCALVCVRVLKRRERVWGRRRRI